MAGTVVLTSTYELGLVRAAVITATGDASDGTFPATTLAALGLGELGGTLRSIRTNPGATAPTSNYDITLVDADGLDRLNGAALNRSSGTSETASLGADVAQGEDLTLTIANNSVVDAVIVITLTWSIAAVGTGMLNGDGTLPVADADLLTAIQTLEGAIHAEDDAHVSTDSGVFGLDVANEAGSDLAADGDYVGRAATIKGERYVRPTIKLVTKTWDPTLDTSAYTAGDNLYTTLYEITGAARYNGGTGRIVDFFSRDADLQSKAHTLHVFDRSVTIPAANAAWSISDADNEYRACAPINSGPFTASSLNSQSSNPTISVPFQCKSDSTSLFVAVTTSEAPTHTASGVQFGVRIEQD